MNIIIPMWQWIMENRLSIAQIIENMLEWEEVQTIPCLKI
jgi:hypothetical protein